MNALRTVLYTARRTYSRRVKNVGIRSKLKLSEKSGLDLDVEELNQDDLDEFEAEYMNADKFYDIHEGEVYDSKERLKNQIVATKYFKKDKDPNFLTAIEKHEIRKLHKSNPEEWTVQRLSESFPALPETIKKIVKSNWSPTSVEKVLQYDATVINNWKQFRAGLLPLSPSLQEHLRKFKGRKIVLPDRDLLTKILIPPKPELPKPKSIFFSTIVKGYLDQNKGNQSNNEELQNGKEAVTEKNISNNIIKDIISKSMFDKKDSIKKEISYNNHELVIMQDQGSLKKNESKEKLTLNEFTKRELTRIYKENPEEGITLLHAYKQQFISQNTSSADIKENTVQSKHMEIPKKEVTLNSVNENNLLELGHTENVDTNLDTYVKIRTSKISEHETYPLPIKIPRNMYKKGKTYRICDCYYDDNGQFLYRVPGLRN